MPGIVESNETRGSARPSGPSSRSSGAIRSPSSSITTSASATERRHTAGTPRLSSSSIASVGAGARAEPEAPLGEQAEDAVLGRGPQADQMQAPLQPLAQRAFLG